MIGVAVTDNKTVLADSASWQCRLEVALGA